MSTVEKFGDNVDKFDLGPYADGKGRPCFVQTVQIRKQLKEMRVGDTIERIYKCLWYLFEKKTGAYRYGFDAEAIWNTQRA